MTARSFAYARPELAPTWVANRSRLAPLIVLGVHAVLGYVVLTAAPVQRQIQEMAPLFVQMVQPASRPEPPMVTPRPLAPPKPVLVKPYVPPIEPVAVESPITVTPSRPAPVEATSEPLPAPAVAAAPAAPAATEPKLVRDIQPLHPVKPIYPAASRRLEEQGRVMVRVLINESGQVTAATVAQSSGYERLDRAALEAVRVATFKPYSENGVVQRAYALIPVSFTMTDA